MTVAKLTAECKVSSEHARQIEQECWQLQGRVNELEVELSQQQRSVGDVTAERESLSHEHQALLINMQEHEARMLEMTNQLAALARNKEGNTVLCMYKYLE